MRNNGLRVLFSPSIERFLGPGLIAVLRRLKLELSAYALDRWSRARLGLFDRPLSSNGSLRLNLGCGKSTLPGWLNIDLYQRADLCLDLRRDLPLPDSSAELIFCEHCLEHLRFPDEVLHFFSECRRVLQPGGCMRVVVPDAETALRAYVKNDGDWFTFENTRHYPRFQTGTFMERVNLIFRQNGEHQFAWDYETLKLTMRKAGFLTVVRAAFRSSEREEFLAIDNPSYHPGSLYMEAIT